MTKTNDLNTRLWDVSEGDDCPECRDGQLQTFENASEVYDTAEQRSGVECDSCISMWLEHPDGDGYER